jgi:hypothetical protein
MLQVLVDADNVPAARLSVLMDALRSVSAEQRLVVAGHPDALSGVDWPAYAELAPAQGWQRADLTLAAAYHPGPEPLILASGDSDFVQLATRHPGPVLIISEAPSGRFHDVATVVDPLHEPGRLQEWLAATVTAAEG